MRGCEGSGQPCGPGVRGHTHQTACGEWLSYGAQRACQSTLIIRSGWISPSPLGWSHPPQPSLPPPLKKRAFAWQSGVDFMMKEKEKRKNEMKNPFGVPQSPIHPKRMAFGNKERFGKVTPLCPLIYSVPPQHLYNVLRGRIQHSKCQKKWQCRFPIIMTGLYLLK